MKRSIKLSFILILAFSIGSGDLFKIAHAATASNFRATNIITDSVFFGSNSMATSQVQAFLNAKVPVCDTNGAQSYNGSISRAQYGTSQGYPPPYICLKSYSQNTPSMPAESGLCNAFNGGNRSSAQIIVDVSVACGVNPQVLIVLLQKEQSLVTDDWPWPTQYTKATGFGCPDTAPCNPSYGGFFYQVYHAARQFKKYSRDRDLFNYTAGRNNNILYNPNTSCGSSSIFIENQATAGLYNYTPYQPNAAALANLYGTGDGCSAYGNRNFWRMFTDWFGSTTGGISLIKSSSSPTIYAWYDNKRQGIPSQDVLNAWGLASLPITETTDASLATIPDGGILTRVARNPYNPSLYMLADRGGTYDLLSNMVSNWGFNPAGASTISTGLVASTVRLGSLSSFVTYPGGAGVYMVDNATSRQFGSASVLQSWGGSTQVVNVSADLFSRLTASTGIFSNQARVGSSEHILSGGKLLTIPTSLVSLYPRNSVVIISPALASTIPKGSETSRFVQGSGAGIYMMDGGKKHGLASLRIMAAYTGSTYAAVTRLSDSELASIPTGQDVTTQLAYSSSDPTKGYFIDRGTKLLPTNFGVSSYGFSTSPATLSLLGDKGTASCRQGLLQAAGSPGVYIMDNGYRRGITSLPALGMIKNSTGDICTADPRDVNAIPRGPDISPFVSSGGENYLLEGDQRYPLDTSTAASMGVSNFSPISPTLANLYTTSGTPMTKSFTIGQNIVFTDSGKYYSTNNLAIGKVWGLTPDSLHGHNPYLLNFISNGGALTQFARPADPRLGTIYLVDNGKLLPISALSHLFNTGYLNQNIPQVSSSYISANQGSVWHGYIAKDSNNTYYVLEGGRKHAIPSSILSNWTGDSSRPATSLSGEFLSLLANSSNATKSVTTGAPGIYGIDNGKRAGIPNLRTYLERYAPAMTVTEHLINSIPYGPAIPSV